MFVVNGILLSRIPFNLLDSQKKVPTHFLRVQWSQTLICIPPKKHFNHFDWKNSISQLFPFIHAYKKYLCCSWIYCFLLFYSIFGLQVWWAYDLFMLIFLTYSITNWNENVWKKAENRFQKNFSHISEDILSGRNW